MPVSALALAVFLFVPHHGVILIVLGVHTVVINTTTINYITGICY